MTMTKNKNWLSLRTWMVLAALGGACFGSPNLLKAQAPAGPLPPTQPSDSRAAAPAAVTPPRPQEPAAQPRTSIFGAWQLDRDDSDDPRKKVQEARGSGSNGGYGGNRRMGGSYPGGGGYGGRRMGSQGESDQQRQKTQELLNPSGKLTLAEAKKDAEVDLFDDQEHKRAFLTDGRKPQKSKDANYQEIAAHWEGTRLVTDEKDPRGNKMSRTYELSYDGTQLYETLHMTVGRNSTPLIIRYVYDQAPGSAASASSASSAPTAAARAHR
jgi:hypothetical protein